MKIRKACPGIVKVLNGKGVLVSNLRTGTLFVFIRAPQTIYIKDRSGGYYTYED